LPDTKRVRGSEFVRRIHKLGRKQGVLVEWLPERGKGSHGTLYYGRRLTVVQHVTRELKKGTLHGMLEQLGLTLKDLP
jgi:mRNA interferase HicA